MSAGETIPANRSNKESFSTIDSALQSGLRDSRERVALLRLEQALIDFMTGDPRVGWMEVGGPANSLVLLPNKNPPAAAPGSIYQSSFHRLLVHRLSDRFGIVREKGLILENSLRLIKVPESKVPQTLLRDLDPAEYAGDNASATPSPTTMATRASPILARSESAGAGGSKPRKLKIMKRQSSHPLKSSTGNPQGGNKTLADSRRVSSSSDLESREKAYAEARARIFSDGSTEEAKSTSSQNGETDDSLGASGHALAQAVASKLSVSESTSTTSPAPATPRQNQSSPEPTTPDQTRAVYRNRAEEAADPDFKRGSAAVVFQQNNMYYGTTPSANHYGYASATPGAVPVTRQPNHLTASAPAFFPGAAVAPYAAAAYPPNVWHQPPTQTLQRPSNRSDQES
mmetsp:Transcript_10382/g.19938  ORF Transcript_10382/g.19938 Transcript_10382/m.19938 type:complete len:400 (-) Transcript_10382:8-1207(-)